LRQLDEPATHERLDWTVSLAFSEFNNWVGVRCYWYILPYLLWI